MSFSNRFGKGLLAASLENEEDVIVEDVQVEDADNVEAAINEADQAEGEVVATQDAIDEGSDDVETLDAIADTLEETEQEGGADPVTAQVAEVAVEAIYKRLGLTRKPMQSMEAFGDKASRVQATRVSVEGIRETAKELWKGVVALFKRVAEWIANFLKSVFTAAGRTKERAKKIAAAAAELKGKGSDEPVTGSFIGVLRNDSFSDKAGYIAVAEGLKTYSTAVSKAAADLASFFDKVDAVTLVENKEKFDSFSTAELTKKLGTNVPSNSWFDKVAAKTYKARGQELRYVGANVATGNLGIAIAVPAEDATGQAGMIAFSKISVVSAPVTNLDNKDVAAPALDAKEIKKVADAVFDGITALEKSKKEMDEIVKAVNKMAKDAESIGKMQNDADNESAQRGKGVAALCRGYSRISGGMITTALSNGVKFGRASLDYAEKSMRNYSAKAEKTEKTAEK